MSYRKENVRSIREKLRESRARALQEAEERKLELYQTVKGFAETDRALARVGLDLFAAATQGRAGLEERIAEIRSANESLQDYRARLLESAGYPADYTNPRFSCSLCEDTGVYREKMCPCVKKALIAAQYESSGLSALLFSETFENFDVSLYPEADRANMQILFDFCKKYAENFSDSTENGILMMGNTGLGKTHLSTAIARTVIDRGYDVQYVTAQDLLNDFEHSRFYRPRDGEEDPNDVYFDCDLLIIDDLGAEAPSQYVVSCLFNLINSRMNRKKPMIINTNLSFADLQTRYTDRVASRLASSNSPLMFRGKDIRQVLLRTRKG